MAQSVSTTAYSSARLVTTSDTVDNFFTALLVQGTGNVTIQCLDGSSLLFTAVPAFTILPVAGKRVMATATTATLIILLN